ncbi:pyridoxamine 5'-phosphate oxidase family protein [Streptomyces triticagri]|uniref:Pyridoxamine 5'-phosphate oxidase family protein n=1 Tax=Streptomyces triticagri TaxID=2293568 RepID=A0A372M2G9_9ACTN|nr:pyridoxamine 5'-phosphate oxidase family protein [Streptomyces triticagri]RFU85108.1 pyridoxamine 5'-phosphate oxidase family protein [Streptomyces triticagri]
MSPEELRAVELLRTTPYGRIAASMRALPFLAVARHLVADGEADRAADASPALVLRLHRGFGYHLACEGTVVAYGADNLGGTAAADTGGLWSVQLVGTCETVTPTPEQLEQFGPVPDLVDGEPFAPVYLRVSPQVIGVHRVDAGYERALKAF